MFPAFPHEFSVPRGQEDRASSPVFLPLLWQIPGLVRLRPRRGPGARNVTNHLGYDSYSDKYHCNDYYHYYCSYSNIYLSIYLSIPARTAQGGGGSFKVRKPIGEVRCCESWMAEQSH